MSKTTKILSPIPGVFYRRPSPDQEEYVKPGDKVKAGDTIGLVEVMKTFHEIKIETDGTIEKFMVDNEDMLEAGQEIAVLIEN